jgi:hypothetical protein
MFDEKADHTTLLNNLKQLGFYLDCLGRANWSLPTEVVDLELAEQIVSIARLMAQPSTHSAREIELWRHCLGPVWKKGMASAKQALIDWQRAVYSEGLSETQADEMAKFVFGTQSVRD